MASKDDFSRIHRKSARWERGDIKFLILDLIKDKPAHGYEIIRAIEERFGGLYSPSAGAIYPTLQMLEDMGYLSSEQKEGRKVYSVTPAGTQFLVEQKDQVGVVRDRMRGFWDRRSTSEDMHDVIDALDDLKKLMRKERRHIDPAKVKLLRDTVARAFQEIETILKG
jgi:DNA-binding PadR family transcriptional regulator